VVRFDAYTATARGVDPRVFTRLAFNHTSGSDTMRNGQGYHGFEHKAAMRGEDGSEWVSVLWGGARHGDLVMCEVKGERTPELVAALRETVPDHRCTRVDSCADLEAPGLWDELLPVVMSIKREFRLRGERRGDWDFPEDGRTQYLGAPSSAVRARMYEKGKQPEYRYLGRSDWVRVECQVRPEKEAKTTYARAGAMEVWGASPFTRKLAARVLEAQVGALPPYALRRENQRDRALRFMCLQYGAHLLSLKDDLGDWKAVGMTLREMIEEARSGKKGVH
jgi:hypothetical protein